MVQAINHITHSLVSECASVGWPVDGIGNVLPYTCFILLEIEDFLLYASFYLRFLSLAWVGLCF